MKQFFRLVIIIPIGPAAESDFAADTICSVQHFTEGSYKIVLMDDSHLGIAGELKKKFPEVDVITTPKNYGRLCGLYITLALAYKYAIENFHFSALLKLDTDALVIGKDYAEYAIKLFENNPVAGMAGQYGFEYDGKPWDISWPKNRIFKDACTLLIFRNPLPNFTLRKWYRQALKNGYKRGESVFGGAYFMSERGLLQLDKLGLLPSYNFEKLKLEEDHLFSLLLVATGFQLADLSEGKLPLACTWRGLPASPQELLSKGKKIIHSTRFWKEIKEKEIRNYFSNHREAIKSIPDEAIL